MSPELLNLLTSFLFLQRIRIVFVTDDTARVNIRLLTRNKKSPSNFKIQTGFVKERTGFK
jgi:hypothetical protein